MRNDRQELAFGTEGQAKLRITKVGVIGLGGLGSQVVQQLAHLGVRQYVLVDADKMQDVNLNRIVGTTPEDIGTFKVRIAEREISRTTDDEEADIRVAID